MRRCCEWFTPGLCGVRAPAVVDCYCLLLSGYALVIVLNAFATELSISGEGDPEKKSRRGWSRWTKPSGKRKTKPKPRGGGSNSYCDLTEMLRQAKRDTIITTKAKLTSPPNCRSLNPSKKTLPSHVLYQCAQDNLSHASTTTAPAATSVLANLSVVHVSA